VAWVIGLYERRPPMPATLRRRRPANLAVLKNDSAKAVRFTTLAALCEALDR
jgi:hypothetical protein